MKRFLPALVFFAVLFGVSLAITAESRPRLSPRASLERLVEGNRRFAADAATGPRRSEARRRAVAPKQAPFAAVLGCADSRLPPEILFDQGLGDLFVVRNAGNVEDDIVLGSLEYAVEHLHVPLIVVLGHERCGAVAAAVQGGDIHGHVRDVTDAIQPAVREAEEHDSKDVDVVVRVNARLVAKRLSEKSEALRKHIESGALAIRGAYYDLDTGRVTLLGEP